MQKNYFYVIQNFFRHFDFKFYEKSEIKPEFLKLSYVWKNGNFRNSVRSCKYNGISCPTQAYQPISLITGEKQKKKNLYLFWFIKFLTFIESYHFSFAYFTVSYITYISTFSFLLAISQQKLVYRFLEKVLYSRNYFLIRNFIWKPPPESGF